MRILTIDVGAGTQDILLYDSESNIENNIKLVLPSPTRIFAKKINKITEQNQDLVIYGETIGGGALTKAIKEHMNNGNKVTMTFNAALSIRNKIEEVEKLGIRVLPNDLDISLFPQTSHLELYEVFWEEIATLLEKIGENINEIDFIAVAVLDHGKAPKGVLDRKFRIKQMANLLRNSPYPWSFAFWEKEIPEQFLRMHSVIREVKKHNPTLQTLVMDTSAAAILGALQDPIVSKKEKLVAMDVGNSHTMVAVIHNNNIKALMEHHTHMLSTEQLVSEIIALADGELKDEQVFDEGGHGVFYLDKNITWEEIEIVAATGPKRKMLENASIPVHFASPSGDVMMTGPVGLVEAIKKKSRRNN